MPSKVNPGTQCLLIVAIGREPSWTGPSGCGWAPGWDSVPANVPHPPNQRCGSAPPLERACGSEQSLLAERNQHLPIISATDPLICVHACMHACIYLTHSMMAGSFTPARKPHSLSQDNTVVGFPVNRKAPGYPLAGQSPD